MMIATTTPYMIGDWYSDPRARGTIRGASDSDTYLFDLTPLSSFGLHGQQGTPYTRWIYQGKVTGDVFIPAATQGYEHIPQEFYAALDQAYMTHEPVEFPDPFLDNLAVQGA
jgi:hypothetical protein